MIQKHSAFPLSRRERPSTPGENHSQPVRITDLKQMPNTARIPTLLFHSAHSPVPMAGHFKPPLLKITPTSRPPLLLPGTFLLPKEKRSQQRATVLSFHIQIHILLYIPSSCILSFCCTQLFHWCLGTYPTHFSRTTLLLLNLLSPEGTLPNSF